MEITHLWYKFNLQSAKIAIVGCVLMAWGISHAQVDTRYNLMNYDEKKLHYGFQMGLNSTRFKLTHSANFVTQDTLVSLRSYASTGFSLGFILNARLGEYFDARLLPTVAFYERAIRYEFKSIPTIDAIFESSIIELPLLIKYKSYRRKNSRLYMVAGLKPSIEVGAKKKQKKNSQLRVKQFDLVLEYGLGADVYYPLFKFSPELRFSLGLRNLFLPDSNIYSDQIDRLSTYTVAMFFMFE